MPSSSELQRGFARALLGDADAALLDAIRGDGLAPAARLDIYRHHVLTTLTDALVATYPVVCRLVNARFFRYAADGYVRAHPPAGPCLFEYGGALAEFLAAFPPCRELAYLPDVARLEWAMNRALHAPDAAPVGGGRLAAVPPEALAEVVLGLDPSASYLASPWPVEGIWRANQPGAELDRAVALDAGGVRLEIRRRGDDVGFRALDAGTWAFRAALAARRRLDAAVAAAQAADPAFDLTRAVRELFDEEIVVEVSPPTQGRMEVSDAN
jgi:hypothetical protein